MRYKPGILVGGNITHDCGTTRAIGWFIEGILPLAALCKSNLRITFQGITNDPLDISVDVLRHVTLPLLRNFGIEHASLVTKRRGCAPKGGGLVEFACSAVRQLRAVHLVHSGQVRRVRGVVFCAKISPTVISRVVEAVKEVLGYFISDIYINAENFKV